jgi:hypothetical protein
MRRRAGCAEKRLRPFREQDSAAEPEFAWIGSGTGELQDRLFLDKKGQVFRRKAELHSARECRLLPPPPCRLRTFGRIPGDPASAAGAQLIGLLFVVVTLGAVRGLSASQSMDAIRRLHHADSSQFQRRSAPGVGCDDAMARGLANWSNSGPWWVGGPHLPNFIALHGVDGIAYDVVPVLANLSLILGGAGLIAGKSFAPYAIAAASVLLLIAGIYGSRDLTLFIVRSRDKT